MVPDEEAPVCRPLHLSYFNDANRDVLDVLRFRPSDLAYRGMWTPASYISHQSFTRATTAGQ